MRVVRLKRRGWVIVNTGDDQMKWYGPYKTKREAEDEITGLKRTLKKEAEDNVRSKGSK